MSNLDLSPIRELFVTPELASALRRDAERMPGWNLRPQQLRELDLLMNGGFFPLKGYLTEADFKASQDRLELASGVFWPLPLSLRVDADCGKGIDPGSDLALRGMDGTLLAIMSVTDKWPDGAGGFHLGGPVKGLQAPQVAGLKPNDQRQAGRKAGHDGIVALGRNHPDYRGILQQLKSRGLPHLMLDLPDLCVDQARLTLIWAVLARNFGASGIVVAAKPVGDDLLAANRHRAGIAILGDLTQLDKRLPAAQPPKAIANPAP